MPQDTLVITPITPLVSLDTLIDAAVQAMPFDDPVYKYDKYVGTIDQIKLHKFGTYVRFSTPDLVGRKWIRLERVIGIVQTQAPAADCASLADEFPNVALDVLLEQDAARAAAAKPAHETDKGRYTGHISYINVRAGYGYIYSDGSSYRFDTRNVLGGLIAASVLSKGTAVTFASGLGLNAVSIVVPGCAASETAYAQWIAKKAAAKAPLPRARRRDIATTAKATA